MSAGRWTDKTRAKHGLPPIGKTYERNKHRQLGDKKPVIRVAPIRRLIHNSNLIEGIDSVLADDQSLAAWEYIVDQTRNNRPITHEVIQRLHGKVVEWQDLEWAGAYRDRGRVEVSIGGKQAPASGIVPRLMDNWLLDFNNRTPKENHIAFEKIHPFEDGNGRVGRLLFWYQEKLYEGKEVKEFTEFLPEDKDEYYEWFTDNNK